MAFFSARQPILDLDKRIFGYELLFRSSIENVFPNVDQEKATSKMIEGLQLDLGLDKISAGKLAFINFTEKSILQALPNLLPKTQVVIEILEDVTPSREVYVQLKKLAIEGYILALDDFVHGSEWEPFYKICQIIKVDCKSIQPTQLESIKELKTRHPHLKLLAEKVESYDEFMLYKANGFELFQGYFFSKPEVIKSVSLSSSQTILSTLLNEITKPDVNVKEITRIFEIDVAVSFKLLRYTQSPLFQRRKKIENIKQAVVMLGHKELERFIMLLFAATFGEGKPHELIKMSMHRAKFCEQIADKADFKSQVSTAFLVGMLSLVDAMLDADLVELIGKMPLSDDIKEALLRHQGWLAEFVDLCHALENGDWSKTEIASVKFNVDMEEMMSIYDESRTWAQERLDAVS
jgi:EAL and modified HD-GYP domain-containing signal transduction protein